MADFRWRTDKGEMLYPTDMETSHLFYTVRLIWNNIAPTSDRIVFISSRRFSAELYTEEYLSEALQVLSAELFIRDLRILSISQRGELNFMCCAMGRPPVCEANIEELLKKDSRYVGPF